MRNEQLFTSLVETARNLSYNIPVVKQPTKVTRVEYPYFKRIIRSLFNKPTYYELNTYISPVYNEPIGGEIKVKIGEEK